jgi:hypothetical protein
MNRSSDSILSVYSDARAEYTKQLCVFLVPAYFQFFIELLEKAKQDIINEPKRALWQFQNYLNEIHDWNMEKVHNEIHKINTNSGCDYLEDLLTAVFIAHTKVLTAIRLSINKKKIEINVPKVEHFLFKVLCETSKLLWSSTYLFRDGISGIEKQQNYRNIEQIINEGILQAVRSLVPVKSILRDFVNNEAGDDEEDSDNEKEEQIKDLVKTQDEVIIPQSVDINDNLEKTQNNNSIFSSDIPIINKVEEETIPVIQEIPKNEIHIPNEESVQTIIINDKPTVRFGEFDAVFDSDNPDKSDMIYEPKDVDDEEEDVPVLEILDEQGIPLAEGIDFDEKLGENFEVDDYESL